MESLRPSPPRINSGLVWARLPIILKAVCSVGDWWILNLAMARQLPG